MTKLYCDYDSRTWLIRERDYEDRWDQGDYDGYYNIIGVYLSSGFREEYESVEEIALGDTVHVVWIEYKSGSTFGKSAGHGEVIAVTKNENLALAAKAWGEASITVRHNRGKKNSYPQWPQELAPPVYGDYKYADLTKQDLFPWTGYFEHAQVVKRAIFVVKE